VPQFYRENKEIEKLMTDRKEKAKVILEKSFSEVEVN